MFFYLGLKIDLFKRISERHHCRWHISVAPTIKSSPQPAHIQLPSREVSSCNHLIEQKHNMASVNAGIGSKFSTANIIDKRLLTPKIAANPKQKEKYFQ